MAGKSPLARLKLHYRQLKDERRTWEPHWRDVQKLIAPQRGRYLSGFSESEANRGDIADKARINGTASRALNILASGMQSGLTSKARQWFVLTHRDPELNEYLPVRQWYDKVQEILEGIFRRSNVYAALLHTYSEMAGFGSGALAVMSHPDRTIYCRPFTAGTYYMSTDQWGEVDVFCYVEFQTARQLVQNYGEDKLPDDVKAAYRNGRYETRFEVVNAVLKHPEDYGIRPGGAFDVASVHFLAKSSDDAPFLRVSGYATWPVMTPRWDVIDTDVYGWSPTRDVIGDVKMLQSMETDALRGIAKGVNPPMRIPPELERRGLATQPGALNTVSSMGEHAVAPLYAVDSNIQQLQYKIDTVVEAIKEGYYNSLFLALLMQDNPQMTATEVAERHEEKILMLGPVLERIHYELLDPLIDRVFRIAWDDGMIPPPPEELEGEPTQIEYVSILSQAQKAVGVNRIEQSVQFLGNLTAVYPEARHILNVYRTFGTYNRMIGTPADIFNDEETYNRQVAAEQQRQQAAEGAAVGESLAQSAAVMKDVDPASVQQLLTGGPGGLAL